MLKQFFILILLANFLFAGIGTLRIIVDFGGKENISIKNCSNSTLNDFLFLNNNTTDTYGDLILNQQNLTNLYLCSPDIYNSTTSNMKYKDFKPSIILFNDQGIKAAPSLYNKKLLTSSSINTLILNYLYKNLNNDNNDISSLQDTYKQLSKFNINNFYLAIDYDSYTALSNSDILTSFFVYLDSLPEKLKDDKLSKKVFEEKIKYLKDLYKFSLDLYSKLLPQYTIIKNNAFLDIWQSGFTKENFCQKDNNNFTISPTATDVVARNCYNCVKNKEANDFQSYYHNYISCENQCIGIQGYSACKIQAKDDGIENDKCFYDNCIHDNVTVNNNNDLENDMLKNITFILYGKIPDVMNSSTTDYFNFAKIPYTNITEGIIKDDKGEVDNNATNLNRNNICRQNIVNNLGETFNYYSQKFRINNPTNLTFNLNNYPTLNKFYSILMDIHSNLITNDIAGLINDTTNKDCISGNYDNNLDKNGNHLNYLSNKKIINFVNVLKFNGNNFYNYSNKIFGLNMYSGYMPTIQQNSTNSLTGGIIVDEDIEAGGGGLDNKGNISLNQSSKCNSDETLLLLYFDNLSNTLQNPEEINKELNAKLTNDENSGFFDVENYQLYLGCYKKGYVIKFVKKLPHILHDKIELLSCYAKWLNEPTIADNNTVVQNNNTSATCLNYFYHNINSTNLQDIYNKFADKTNDLVVFGSIVHFNIYNSEDLFKNKLNGNPEKDEYTNIFQNIIPTIPYNDMILEKYTLTETVCNVAKDYYQIQKVDDNGTKMVDENGNPIMELVKGEIDCYNNTSNQFLYNYKHNYDYNTQDYMLMINSYSPIKLSNINTLSVDDRNMMSINNEYTAFSTLKNKKTNKDCPMLYFHPQNITIEDYVEDNKYCLNNNYSDYNTVEKPFISNKFNNYISKILNFAQSNNITINNSVTNDNFYTYQFPADVAFLYEPAFYGVNDHVLYEINQINANDIVNVIKNNSNNNNLNIVNKNMNLAQEDTNLDLSKYDVLYFDQNINISNFSNNSMQILTNNNVITKD